MESPPPPSVRWDQRSDLRLAAFGALAVVAVYLGFLGVSVAAAEKFIRGWGYYVIALSFVGWVVALVRSGGFLAGVRAAPRRELAVGAALVALFSVLAWVHEEFRSKILFDEYVVQSTAFNMHHFREVATMVRGYDLLGVFASTDNYLDKRPYFFAFLLSLCHDLTGYRSGNALALNAALFPVTLGLAGWIGRRLAGWRGAVLAIALLGSLPLLSQNASGSGIELLNVAMLLLATGLGARYLAAPDEHRLSAFVLTVVLLAQTRYESALYPGVAALVILLGWWRERRVVLSWPAIVAPLLFIPLALHNKVLSNSPELWELRDKQTSRFSPEYLADNLAGAGRFLFNTDLRHANSLLLTVTGAAGLAWLLVAWIRRRGRLTGLTPMQLSLLCFGLGMAANTVLVQFYYWASFDDHMSARFSLPLHLLLAFAVVLLAQAADRRGPVSAVLAAAAVIFALGVAVPKQAHHLYSRVGIDEIEWELRTVAARPPASRIVISNKSTLPWLLEKTPSILLLRARGMADRLAEQLATNAFPEILVSQSLRPTTADGQHQLVPEDRLPAGFRLVPVAEKRFGTKIARLSRVVAIELPAAAAPAAPAAQ